MADQAFPDFAFKSQPALSTMVARTMPDRYADMVNVMDFGTTGYTVGSGGDDSPYIQAAFDAAFKTSGTPNGKANAFKNKMVYFPPGLYRANGLTLTQVYGARIFGAGNLTTQLAYNGSSSGGFTIRTNGFEASSFENMWITGGYATGGVTISPTFETMAIDLSWDGTTGGSDPVKLRDILLVNMNMGGAKYGVRIAENGIGGASVMLLHTSPAANWFGIRQNGDECLTTVYGGGISDCHYGVNVAKGSLNWQGSLGAGHYSSSGYDGQTDILHESFGTSVMSGCRTESQNAVYATRGTVTLNGVLHNLSPNSPSIAYTVDGAAATGGPAQVSLNGCSCGNVGNLNSGVIKGDVNLAIRATSFAGELLQDIFAGFTGKITYWARAFPLTIATLPAHPADGLMLTVSDALNSTLWGNQVAAGSNHSLVRYNAALSQWLVVGK